jgi:Do/DeqQ family serine protease
MAPRRLAVTAILLGAAFTAGLMVTGRLRDTVDIAAQSTTAPRPSGAPAAAASSAALPDFSRVAERTVPVVVNISARQVVRRSNSPFGDDPFFSFFGGGDDIFGAREQVQSSLGSGVIVSPDGYILTNNHVVVGESQRMALQGLDVSVSLADKREMPARVIGVDPATDLALLKVDAANLPTMPWGDSSKLKVAEWVLAIGNPYQLSQTVTLGIVSAVGRTNLGVSAYEDFVQTDAAINPGNSGGALVNGRGELVGINTVIFSQSGGYQGIGFAVSSNLAQRVVADLKQHGEVRRGSIGYVDLSPMNAQVAQELRVPDQRGLVVVRMGRTSSAYQAGVRIGDVVRAFNGTAISDTSQLSRMIQDARIGSTANLSVLREGKLVEIKVPIVRRTASF